MSEDRDLTSAEQLETALRAAKLARVSLALVDANTTWQIRMNAVLVMNELVALNLWCDDLVAMGEPKE